MEMVIRHVSTPYFPEERDRIIAYLRESPLDRPRPALVKDVVYRLVENLFAKADEPTCKRIMNLLDAVAHMHRELTETALSSTLEKLLGQIPPDRLKHTIMLFHRLPESWDFISSGWKVKIEEYVKTMPDNDVLYVLAWAFQTVPLESSALIRVRTATPYEMGEMIAVSSPLLARKILDIALERLSRSGNFGHTNEISKSCLRRHKEMLTRKDLEAIVKAANEASAELGTSRVLLTIPLHSVLSRKLKEIYCWTSTT